MAKQKPVFPPQAPKGVPDGQSPSKKRGATKPPMKKASKKKKK